MKILIVYFSRTGTTERVAQVMGEALGAELERLADSADYSGALGYFRAGKAAIKKQLAEIGPAKHDPASYDLVVIGSPVWAGLCAPAIRTYVKENKEKIRQAALFCTQGGAREQKIFTDLESVLDARPLATIFFTTKEVRQDNFQAKMQDFIKKMA